MLCETLSMSERHECCELSEFPRDILLLFTPQKYWDSGLSLLWGVWKMETDSTARKTHTHTHQNRKKEGIELFDWTDIDLKVIGPTSSHWYFFYWWAMVDTEMSFHFGSFCVFLVYTRTSAWRWNCFPINSILKQRKTQNSSKCFLEKAKGNLWSRMNHSTNGDGSTMAASLHRYPVVNEREGTWGVNIMEN